MKPAAILLLFAISCGREGVAPIAAKKRIAPKTGSSAELVARTEVGDKMPAYSSTDLDGKPFDLASERQSVVFLNVWATWCGPCRFEIPQLHALQEKYGSRGFKVIGVSVDETGADTVKQFVRDERISYPIVLDPEGKVANVLQTTVLPTSVIVDRSGTIVWRRVGAVSPNELKDVHAIINRALSASGGSGKSPTAPPSR